MTDQTNSHSPNGELGTWNIHYFYELRAKVNDVRTRTPEEGIEAAMPNQELIEKAAGKASGIEYAEIEKNEILFYLVDEVDEAGEIVERYYTYDSDGYHLADLSDRSADAIMRRLYARLIHDWDLKTVEEALRQRDLLNQSREILREFRGAVNSYLYGTWEGSEDDMLNKLDDIIWRASAVETEIEARLSSQEES